MAGKVDWYMGALAALLVVVAVSVPILLNLGLPLTHPAWLSAYVATLGSLFVLVRARRVAWGSGEGPEEPIRSDAQASGGSAAASVVNSPGAEVRQVVFGTYKTRPREPVVRPAEHYQHSDHWEVLEDLPMRHKEILYSILDSPKGKRTLEHSSEVTVLHGHGLLEPRVSLTRYETVFRIPDGLSDLVATFREEGCRDHVRKEISEAEADAAKQAFLRLFTTELLPQSLPKEVWMAGRWLRRTWVLDEEHDQERGEFRFNLSRQARSVMSDGLWGEPLRHSEITIKEEALEGYDPDAPDYSGRGLLIEHMWHPSGHDDY